MRYFLNVQTTENAYLEQERQFESFDEVLKEVCTRYLNDPDKPIRTLGYFALCENRISWLIIKRTTAGIHLREDIKQIDILSERGLLELKTHDAKAQ